MALTSTSGGTHSADPAAKLANEDYITSALFVKLKVEVGSLDGLDGHR